MVGLSAVVAVVDKDEVVVEDEGEVGVEDVVGVDDGVEFADGVEGGVDGWALMVVEARTYWVLGGDLMGCCV